MLIPRLWSVLTLTLAVASAARAQTLPPLTTAPAPAAPTAAPSSAPARLPLLTDPLPATPLPVAVPYIEDLSACKLPNNMVLIPAPNSRTAGNGNLLRIATGSMVPFPVIGPDGKPQSPDQVLANLRASKNADLEFLPDADGSLWAVSSRISDLGYTYLADAAAKNPSPPMEIRATSMTREGLMPVSEGHTYLVQASDGKFALLRVLEKTSEGCVVQYVYQPSGEMAFAVPPTQRVPYRTPVTAMPSFPGAGAPNIGPIAAPPTETTPPRIAAVAATNSAPTPLFPPDISFPPDPTLGRPSIPITPAPSYTAPPIHPTLGPGDIYDPATKTIRLVSGSNSAPPATATPAAQGTGAADPNLDSFMRQRQSLVAARMAALQAPARTEIEIARKAQAIEELAYLHADEAADALVDQISFLNTRSSSQQFSIDSLHPCFTALKHLGKPATIAALKGLRNLDPDAPGEAINSPMYKAGLLAQVVRAIEGEDIADVLLKNDMARESNPSRVAMYEFLLRKPGNP